MGEQSELPEILPAPSAPVTKPARAPRRAAPVARARKLVAVGGGKGGIGKSLVSANLGIALAQKGATVALIDADLGGANLHTCLGVPQPDISLSDFINHRVDKLEGALVPTGVERLQLISGAQDMLDAANPKHGQKARLLRNMRSLDVDFVILDLGAGTAFNVLDFFLAADLGLCVLLPEPTSIENAYRFIKAAFFRRLQTHADPDTAQVVAEVLAGRDPTASNPWDLVAGRYAPETVITGTVRSMVAASGICRLTRR